jgi:pilus assembly protein CpaB
VTVLGVGGSTLTTRTTQESGETSTEQVPSAVLTLALTPAQAERVVFAVTEGQIYLGLLGEKVRGETGSGVTATNLFEVSP